MCSHLIFVRVILIMFNCRTGKNVFLVDNIDIKKYLVKPHE